MTSHVGGRLTTVALVRSDGIEKHKREVTWKRGVVRGFSHAARRRLMRRINSVNRLAYREVPAFLTLTYPREYSSEPSVYRAHCRAFLKRLRRHFGEVPVIWRLEFQRRGAPHFHMLCFDVAATDQVRDWCLVNWYEVVGSGDRRHLRHGADLQRLKSWKHVCVYLSKYLAKPDPKRRHGHIPVGRYWGVEAGSALRVHPISWTINYAAGIRYRRTLQRYAGMRRRGGQHEKGATVFLSLETASDLTGAIVGASRPHRGRRPLPGPRPATPPPQGTGVITDTLAP